MDEEIFDSTWSASPESPTKYAEPETPIVNSIGASSFDFIEREESFTEELERTEIMENFKALNFRIETSVKYGRRNLRDFLDLLHIETLFDETFEPKIMENIKEKNNLNNDEKFAVDLVCKSLKNMGDFGNERIGAINEIYIKYLDKYFKFAHENDVAMRFTEIILYSFCSLKCRSLVVPENYFQKYFNIKYSPKIQLGAVVANSFVEKEFNEKSNGDVILFILGIWKEAKSDETFFSFDEKKITNCLYREVAKLAKFITKCQENIYNILCQIIDGISHMDSIRTFQLSPGIMNLLNTTNKSKIFQWEFNPIKFIEENNVAISSFHVSINILSKCCQASAEIPFHEMNLLKTFKEFSHFISSNFISQRIYESLLYCICNVVDKREIRNKEFSNIKVFKEYFLDPKVSTEIKLASAFILSYLYTDEEEGIKSNILRYLESVLANPVMKLHESYYRFKEEVIKNCIGLLNRKSAEK